MNSEQLKAYIGVAHYVQQQVDLTILDNGSVSFVKGKEEFKEEIKTSVKVDEASHADEASYATDAGTAHNAAHAQSADEAVNAVNAGHADYADNVKYNGETLFVEGKLKSKAILDGSINGQKIANASITTLHIEDNAITSAEIANGAVGTDNIKDGAITSDKIANGAISKYKIKDEDITEVGTDYIELKYRKNDSRILEYNTFPDNLTIDFSNVMNILDGDSSAYIHHTIKLIQKNDSHRVEISQNYTFTDTLYYDFLPILEYNAEDGIIYSEVRTDIPDFGHSECIDIEILGHKTEDGFLKFLIKNKVTIRYE